MAVLSNIKRENFCRLTIEGAKYGWTQADIYMRSGYRTTAHAAEVNASRLLKNAEIQARIAELTAPATRKVRATAADLLEKTERVYDRAVEIDRLADANRAVELQGKLGGALVDRVEIGGVGEFRECSTPEAVITSLIERADGDAHAVLDQLHRMTELVELHIAGQATVVDAKPKVKVDEAERSLSIYRPRL
jgi:hypothetical protein